MTRTPSTHRALQNSSGSAQRGTNPAPLEAASSRLTDRIYEEMLEQMEARVKTADGQKTLEMRMELSEHPFGTMKRAFNQGYLLLKGLRKVKAEMGFTMLVYNLRRALNILGTKALIASLE